MIDLSNLDWKKIGLVAGFIAVAVIAAYLIYSLFRFTNHRAT